MRADGFTLRPLRDSDTPRVAELANNRKIWSNVRDRFPHPYTLADAEMFRTTAREHTPPAILAIASGEALVGMVGLEFRDDVHRKVGEVGYWVGEPYWGQGIATQALAAFSEYAFRSFDLVRLEAFVYHTNVAWTRVLEKAGFEFEGRLRSRVLKDGELLDDLVYARLLDEEEIEEE